MKFQYIKDKVSAYFTKGNERSVAVKKNIAVSLVLKCISILVSLQVVPLTIGYVNPTKYGIWLTLSSIIAWLSYEVGKRICQYYICSALLALFRNFIDNLGGE